MEEKTIVRTETADLQQEVQPQPMENEKLDRARQFVNYTGENVFLTGKAGTGKTTFLHEIKNKGLKRMVVVAPTGVAAINAGGVTIHSFFQMPFGPIIPGMKKNSARRTEKTRGDFIQRNFSKEKINIIRSIDLLVIDEISMVRADLLDGIDKVLRKYRDRTKAFGGVQLLMIGDLEQLAPVVRDDEWQILRDHYENAFFFSSKALQKTNYVSIILEHVYRQSDQRFIDMLNRVRNKNLDPQTIHELNSRFIPGFIGQETEGYIILTTHNAQANSINKSRLELLDTEKHVFQAEVTGDFPEHSYPTFPALELKVGAQVMFVKNDVSKEKRYYNGKIGIIEEIEDEIIFIRCENEEDIIDVTPVEWENKKYTIDTESKEIDEKITGTFRQYPLKPAWAITIHKSQGLTFEKAVIDARAAFAHGQVYVALSRCKSLEGMVLNAPIDARGLIHNRDVSGFTRDVEENPPDTKRFRKAKKTFQENLLKDLFSYDDIDFHLRQLLKDTRTYSALITGSISKEVVSAHKRFAGEILSVSHRFLPKIGPMLDENYDLERNLRLQEKISGGSQYFLKKNAELFGNWLNQPNFETDNKEIKKRLNKSIDRLRELIMIKEKCFESCKNGFELPVYLEIKAKAQLEELPKRKKSTKIEESEIGDVRNPNLYGAIMRWRNKMAEEKGLPHYMILHLKTIVTLSNYAPATLKEMKKVKGIGKATIDKYGEELLNIIAESDAVNMLNAEEIKANSKIKKETKARVKPKPSADISFEIYKSGKSIAQIAKERGLAESTIESHLGEKIYEGKLDVLEMIDRQKFQEIKAYFEKAESEKLSDAREYLGEEYSYAELRYVQMFLRRNAKK